MYLLPVGWLDDVSDKANRRGGVNFIMELAVMGEEGVEEWAKHTTLRYTSDGGGAAVARPK